MAKAKTTKARPTRRARPKRSTRAKDVSVFPGQDLRIHVLGARSKEMACWTAQADAAGTVVLRAPAETPAQEPPQAAPNAAGTLVPA